MSKINFNLKSPREERSLIVIRYALPTGRLNLSTGVTIPTKHWNHRQQCIRETEEFREGRDLQFKLDELAGMIRKVHHIYHQRGVRPSVAEFKSELNLLINGAPNDNTTFHDYLDKFVRYRQQSVDYKKESIKVYKTLRKHFFNYQRRRLGLQELTVDLLVGFIDYLRRKGYSDNHVHKMVSTMKTVLNEATEKGLNNNMAYKSRHFRARKRDADNIYLTEDEIKAVYDLDLTTNPGLEQTRDLFIIGCYTGLRYSDYSKLTRQNLIDLDNGRQAFRVIVYKTNDIVIIPIHPVAQEILDKYDYDIPEGNSNQVMNRQLKEIAKRAGLTQTYQKRTFRGNKAEIDTRQKYQLVCTHTARRSFASNAYKAKVPVPSIMKITGHKKTETFMKYISLSKLEHALLMSENAFFSP